jgi:hypothetical protein
MLRQPSGEGPIAAAGAAVRAVARSGTAAQVAEVERLLEALSRGPGPAAAERLCARLARLGPAPGASAVGGDGGRAP